MPLQVPSSGRVAAVLAAVLTLATVAVWTPGTALAGEVTPGSDSGGDPYFPADGNGGYDATHYRIVNTYRPETDRLRGWTRVRLVPEAALSSFFLDLVLTPDRVRVGGVEASFAKTSAHELQVTPAAPLVTGRPVTVKVSYHGTPSALDGAGAQPGSDLYFHVPGETAAIGEPQNGPWWFAANETPRDKATFDITTRVPRGEQVIGNGELVSRRTTGEGLRAWRWVAEEPMATYLAFFVAGRFALERGHHDGRSYTYAVSRRLGADGVRSGLEALQRTPVLVAWSEDHFGPYPFSAVGGVALGQSVGYALETQTRPVYPGVPGTLLQVHELAHQWFGDDVTLARWRDIWLNEGFATYAEWLWRADHGGAAIRTQLLDAYGGLPADSTFWSLEIGDPGADDLFDRPVYLRGAMTLAALRSRIGSADLAEVVWTWTAVHGGGNVVSEDFEALAEQVSGEDLDGFFAAWIDGTERPARTAENGLS